MCHEPAFEKVMDWRCAKKTHRAQFYPVRRSHPDHGNRFTRAIPWVTGSQNRVLQNLFIHKKILTFISFF